MFAQPRLIDGGIHTQCVCVRCCPPKACVSAVQAGLIKQGRLQCGEE